MFQDLWIITKAGLVLYSRVYDPKINDQLFGGLIASILLYAERASGSLSQFRLGSTNYLILKEGEIIFVVNFSKEFKEKKIQEELKIISRKFFEKYPNPVKNWNGDLNFFSDFEEEIEDFLEPPIKQFWDSVK